MRNKSILLPILFLLLAVPTTRADDLQEATNIALAEYKSFLQLCLDPLTRKQFNLTEEDVIHEATLGEPMQLMVVPPDRIRNYKKGMTLDQCIVPIKTYYIPVIFNNRMKLMITVNKYAGESHYKIGALGFDWLAKEIALIRKEFPLHKGFTPVLCQSPATQFFSFHIPQKDKFNLTIIHPGDNEQKNVYLHLSSLEDAMREYGELLKSRTTSKELK